MRGRILNDVMEVYHSGLVEMDTRRMFGGYVDGLKSVPMLLYLQQGEDEGKITEPTEVDTLIQFIPQSAAAYVVTCYEIIVIVMTFILSISVGIGFITSFQMTRRRRYEFANMRSVGIGKGKIFLGFMFEQSFLCAIGVVFGFFAFLLVSGAATVAESSLFFC